MCSDGICISERLLPECPSLHLHLCPAYLAYGTKRMSASRQTSRRCHRPAAGSWPMCLPIPAVQD